jgi:hypothetical protein
MKRISLFLIVLVILLSPPLLCAEEDDGYPPAGMEIIKIGDTSVVVPKGTRIRKEGDLNVVEDISEYASRRFVDVEDRFERIEANHDKLKRSVKDNFIAVGARQEILEEEIEYLREALRNIKANKASPEEEIRVDVQLENQEKNR